MLKYIEVSNPELSPESFKIPFDNVLSWDKLFPGFADELEGFTIAEETWPEMDEISRQASVIAIMAYRCYGEEAVSVED